MRCFKCKFHQGGHMWNRCDLMEAEYYREYYEKACPFIDSNYVVKMDCPELGLKKSEVAE